MLSDFLWDVAGPGIAGVSSPTNPIIRFVDIPRIVSLARSHPSRPLVVVDNTFLSLFHQSPLLLGVDVVVMGAAILPSPSCPFRPETAFPSERPQCNSKSRRLLVGPARCKDPPSANGVNALKVAQALQRSPHVEEVIYPGLDSHPRNDIAYRQLSPHAKKFVDSLRLSDSADGNMEVKVNSFGKQMTTNTYCFSDTLSHMVVWYPSAFEGASEADQFLTATRLFTLAESLGGVESLAELPAQMTRASIPEAERAILGTGDNLIRLSVGVEEVEDLVRDLEHALEAALGDVRLTNGSH